ncbi:hypothetical protein [Mucilaginibacter sp. 3215]|uniref:hypothetical protein n=1 Tax=Mucilaginibacter sp. 3215 TaxID=3373912 RepID=UPI003D20BD81
MKAEVPLTWTPGAPSKTAQILLKLHVYFPPKNKTWLPLDYKLSKEELAACFESKKPKKESQLPIVFQLGEHVLAKSFG